MADKKAGRVKESNSNQQLYTIVVGSPADDFVRHTISVLGEYELEYVLCDNVYLAVGRLAKNTRRNVLVIGRLEQLSREEGRFFSRMEGIGLFCCCLAGGGSDRRRRRQILAATQAGAFVVNEPAEIGEIIIKLLAGSLALSLEMKGRSGPSAFIKDEFLTTRAELDALLGV